jgi:uncharacterized membrane protein
MKGTKWLAALPVVAALALTAALYAYLPANMAIHWDGRGMADGFWPREVGAVLLPVVMGLGVAVFWGLPLRRLDGEPLGEFFRTYYDILVFVFMIFLLYLQALILAWNVDYRFDMMWALAPGLALLFVFVGKVTEYAEPNRWVGIRTQWTLGDVEVWEKVHRVGGKLMQVAAVLSVGGLLLRPWGPWLTLILPGLVAVGLIPYSYVVYRSLRRGEK